MDKQIGEIRKTRKFYSVLFKKLKHRDDVVVERYKLKYNRGRYKFIKIISKEIKPEDKVVLIRAGIHGDEIAGPITILRQINEIIDHAHRRNVKLIIYPLGNPSGFENGTRYNIDGDKGELGNNDFLRYELENGELTGDIKDSNGFKYWYWSSDENLQLDLPLETQIMHRLLKRDPLSQIAAVIDLHQDYITPDAPPAAYHYSFGDLTVYRKIIEKIQAIAPLFKNKDIGAGQASEMKSDENGFIVRHDGTLPDLSYRLGTKYCVTVETTGSTPLDDACRVNLIWIFGIIDLVIDSFQSEKFCQ